MKRNVYTAILFVLVMGLLGANLVLAQSGDPGQVSDDEVNAIAKQLYCPVCENIPLDVCPTQACSQWRDLIREKIALGWPEAEIKQYFVNQYGDRVLAAPPPSGLNWLVYIIPPAAILLGAFILYRAFSSWKKPAAGTAADSPVDIPKDEYLTRLEEELRNR